MQELTYFNGEFVEPGAKVISIDDRGYALSIPELWVLLQLIEQMTGG